MKAPAEKGDYILQWRWDNEQTPQIWTTCADIKVDDIAKSKLGAGGKAGGAPSLMAGLAAAVAMAVAAVGLGARE